MPIEKFINILDIIGVLQGIIFGIYFIYKSKNNKPFLFFSLFILTFSIELFSSIIENNEILNVYPNLKYLPINFNFLTLPFFYIYLHKVSIFNNQKFNYKILFLGGFEILIGFVLSISDIGSSIFEFFMFLRNLVSVLFVPFNIYVFINIIKLINKHTKIIELEFSNTNNLSLKWCKQISFILMTSLLIYTLTIFNEYNLILDLFLSLLNIFIIYWLSLKGLKQSIIQSIHKEHPNLTGRKIKEQSIPKEEIEMLYNTITQVIIQQKLFANIDLTILDISKKTELHSKKISHVINQYGNKNFNSYINSFRINHAKKMLKNKKHYFFSIEGIANESGFKSRSAFYKAFKRSTNITPKKYRDKYLF